jgi:transcription elongation factor GreB
MDDLEDDEEKAPFRRYLTRSGAERMHRELVHLLNEERPKVTAEVSAAAAQGDRSENAEYIYGKKRLRELDRRIRFLSKRLDDLEIVEPDPARSDGRIYFGAYVRLEDADGNEHRYRIVGADESEAEKGWISIDSPVARALLRREEGDEVVVRRPAGPMRFEVLEVRYRPFDERPA